MDVREAIAGGAQCRGQKKSAANGRADKGLEIFFVNEKVCFGKQRVQYSLSVGHALTVHDTIICYVGRNNRG
ncbi:MAG: hypothetical protein V4793_21540 [Paraburkholderia tropica]